MGLFLAQNTPPYGQQACRKRAFKHGNHRHTFESTKATLAFERKYLRQVPRFKTREKLFAHIFEQALPDGLCLEFGT